MTILKYGFMQSCGCLYDDPEMDECCFNSDYVDMGALARRLI